MKLTRHRRRRRRSKFRIAIVTATAAISLAYAGLLTRAWLQARRIADRPAVAIHAPTIHSGVQPAVLRDDTRRVYPFSIIRGGAYSKEELIGALDADPVAESHYRDFRRSRLHTVRSPFVKPVYLSYRKNNVVYWTSHPIALQEGETLLTDGDLYARARCGNRISLVPLPPVAEAEPLSETLDTPEIPLPVIPEVLLESAAKTESQPVPVDHPEDFSNPKPSLEPKPPVVPEPIQSPVLYSTLIGVLPYITIHPVTPVPIHVEPVTYPTIIYPTPPVFVPPTTFPYTPPTIVIPPTPSETTTPEPAQLVPIVVAVGALAFLKVRRRAPSR